jgi:hypothetical protein
MPTFHSGTEAISQYAVIGTCAAPRAVCHVGLLGNAQRVTAGSEVPVIDMGPPLNLGNGGAPLGQTAAHVIGWLEGMTREERDGIAEWIADLRTGTMSFAYLAHPGHQFDESNGRVTRMRFSCAGFAERCYALGARVLLIGSGDLPEVPLPILQGIWGRRVESAAVRRRVGLQGDGPWRVLMPGYLLHALNAPRGMLPYAPMAEDFAF